MRHAIVASLLGLLLPVVRSKQLLRRENREAPVPLGVCEANATQTYQPYKKSLETHPLPAWWQDAKLGIFIHWGLFSVPAFASRKYYFNQKVHNWTDYWLHKPYAEWYLHQALLPGSATEEFHRSHFNETPSQESYLEHFIPIFNEEVAKWDPQQMARTFRGAGAKYVVLVTRHHDSFCLWPTVRKNPRRRDDQQHASRDVVGELTRAVRAEGMEMGLYYSGGLDWSYSMEFDTPKEKDFEETSYARLKELIDRYHPSILWDDIDWPGSGRAKIDRLNKVFADYFNEGCPQGVVNDRWYELSDRQTPKSRRVSKFLGDFGTPEYKQGGHVEERPFELCRGIGRSFGYNAEEGDDDYMTPEEAVWLLADVVARNGNLLLNVGPAANGSIPEGQARVLRGLSAWMEVNEEALRGARPYLPPDTAVEGDFRYTQRDGQVFAIVRNTTTATPLVLDHPELMRPEAKGQLLAAGGPRPLELVEAGWKLPKESRLDGAMPFVLRFSLAA